MKNLMKKSILIWSEMMKNWSARFFLPPWHPPLSVASTTWVVLFRHQQHGFCFVPMLTTWLPKLKKNWQGKVVWLLERLRESSHARVTSVKSHNKHCRTKANIKENKKENRKKRIWVRRRSKGKEYLDVNNEKESRFLPTQGSTNTSKPVGSPTSA